MLDSIAHFGLQLTLNRPCHLDTHARALQASQHETAPPAAAAAVEVHAGTMDVE